MRNENRSDSQVKQPGCSHESGEGKGVPVTGFADYRDQTVVERV